MTRTTASTELVKKHHHKRTKPPKVALVLSGGGIKGMAHVGVLEVLHQAKIALDLIVGCSAGAIVGALYTDRQDVDHVKKIALEMASFSGNYRLFGLPSLYKGFMKGYGLFSMEKIKKHLSKIIRATTFEHLQIPLTVVATNLNEGYLKPFSSGELIQTICASAAIPGIFQPICIEGQYYVDGYLLEPLPIAIAKEQGARLTIGVNVCNNLPCLDTSKLSNVILHSLDIVARHRIQNSLRQADIIIDPDFIGVGHLFTSKKGATKLYEAGKKTAERMLPTIQKRIDELD